MIRKCCYNCNRCFSAPDNEFECRSITGKILKSMDTETVMKELCDNFQCDCDGADPYEQNVCFKEGECDWIK